MRKKLCPSAHTLHRICGWSSGAALAFVAAAARAEEPCSAGDWFCEPAASEAAPPERPSEPDAEASPGREPPSLPQGKLGRHRRIELGYDPPRPPHLRRPFLKWALDVHALGAFLDGEDASTNASMGGLGAGIRYRFLPEFALESSLELSFGTDYNGDKRHEAALLLHAVGTLNPRSAVRAYVFGGLGAAWAEVDRPRLDSPPAWVLAQEDYEYFGVDAGFGVEVRVTPRTAIKADLLGFLRERTDDDRYVRPEFVDPVSGRTTNASSGALIRVGGLFYF